MKTELAERLPADAVSTYETLKGLRRSAPERHYHILSDADFAKIADPVEAHSVYWHDMLKRVHIVVLVSSYKTLRWMEAMDSNVDNFYGFCSSLRGLVESVADTFYTLYKVPLTIAADFVTIKKQIERTSQVLADHPGLEQTLLHYLQATKLNRTEKRELPKFLNSEPLVKYIESIDDDTRRVFTLYSFLCGISHPSYESNCVFLALRSSGAVVFSDSSEFESKSIFELLKEHNPAIRNIFRRYYNILHSTMLVLNKFDIAGLSFVFGGAGTFEEGVVWQEFRQKIEESERRYMGQILG